MADEGDEPPKSKADFERMSLSSLKREMEIQKAKTATAREESKARLAEREKKAKAFPWGMVLGIVVVGIGAFFGLVYALRDTFPEVAHSVLFMYTAPPDAGIVERPDAWVAVDAGHDGGVHHVAHHPHPSGTPPGSGDDLGLGDLGGGSGDPIGGVAP
jgi:hypothetical protein